MTATTAAPPRIVTLDIVRGIAVMGILAMNITGFAMPEAAYMNPAAYGTHSWADLASWVFNFIFFDGRMRGLFSFLFGASILLVIQRAEASGQSPGRVHYSRMFWLLVFGLIHYFLIWFGDILALYAPIGMIAFAFRKARVKTLLIWAAALLTIQFLLFCFFAFFFYSAHAAALAPGADAAALAQWNEMRSGIGLYTPQALQETLALHRGGFLGLAHHMVTEQWSGPIQGIVFFGWETLAYMLLGMAALRSGFITGDWQPRSYRRIFAIGFAIGVPVYALLAWLAIRFDFEPEAIMAFGIAATVPFRPLMIVATASLVILLTRKGGALVQRIAATGRAAFTNYLGTSLFMTFIFYGWGFGYFGELTRIQLWVPVLAAWALMLIWSKPWLDHYLYGPFEWLWRSLARGRPQPMRKRPAVAVEEAVA